MLSKDDPKATWKFIRRTSFTQTKGSSPLPDIELANQYFSDLVHEEAGSFLHFTNVNTLSTSVEDNFQIAPLDVISTCNLLKRIKPNTYSYGSRRHPCLPDQKARPVYFAQHCSA